MYIYHVHTGNVKLRKAGTMISVITSNCSTHLVNEEKKESYTLGSLNYPNHNKILYLYVSHPIATHYCLLTHSKHFAEKS